MQVIGGGVRRGMGNSNVEVRLRTRDLFIGMERKALGFVKLWEGWMMNVEG